MKYTISITNHARELSFEGERFAQVEEAVDLGNSGQSELRLTLYAVDGGGFVPVIESLQVDTATAVVEAELVDTANDVDVFFCLFEPCEYLPEDLVKSDSGKKLRSALSAAHLRLIDAIVEILNSYVAAHPDSEVVREETPKQPSRFWKLIGLD